MALLLAVVISALRLGWFDQPWWVLVAWGLFLLLGAVLAALGIRHLRALTPSWMARHLEGLGARRGGSLTALLELPASGTSGALLQAADRRHAGDLSRDGQLQLRPLAAAFRLRALGGTGILVLGLTAFTATSPFSGAAATLWHPGRAWTATVSPVMIRAAHDQVDRGATVDVALRALGRRRAILWTRAPGESWRGRAVQLDSTGEATVSVGPLETDLFARITSGSRGSDTVQVKVRIPAFLGSLAVTAHYPKYLHLDEEPIPTNGDTVPLPAGTRLETRGDATAPLSVAAWVSSGSVDSLDIANSHFSGSFVPAASRGYRLALSTASGGPLAGDTSRLLLRIIPDSAPQVDVPVPGADTVAPLSLHLPLVIDARDDHGLDRLVVESRRVSSLGFADPARLETVALPAAAPDHAILSFDLDLNQRGLLPGDTVHYFVRATDNSPQANVGRSREFVLRLATLSEIRAAERQASQSVGARLDSIVAQSQRLERQTGDLAQERAREAGEQRTGSSDQSMSFEQAKRAEAAAAAQEQLIKQAEDLKRSVEAIQQSAKAAGLNDPAWQQRLQEIREQLDRALTPELRQRLAELQSALKDLDPERTKDALAQLADAQKQLQEALERSRELFRRAAVEGDMANLTAETKELTRQQQDWARQVPAADSSRAAAEERQLAARTDSLAAALQKLSREAGDAKAEQKLGEAASQVQQAARQMSQASQSARSGQRQRAQKQGEDAAKALQPLGEQLDQQRKDLQQEWREEVAETMGRAMSETSRLSERQLALSDALKRGDASAAARSEQGALSEGLDRVMAQLKDAAGKNALVSAQSTVALATAKDQMRQALDALSTAAPNAREAADHAGQAVDAMNAASYQLFKNRNDVSGAGSGSGLAEALEQMSKMAAQQGQIGQQSGGLLPMAGNSGAVQDQLRRLGAQQRALSEQLERMRASGNSPGAGTMADEAKDLARRLEAGRIDRQTVDRQERLFRRMLDAGRTLQGQEEDQKKERQSTTATDDSVHLPPALRASILARDSVLRLPSWETLQELSPEERKLVLEYFRRLADHPDSGSAPR